MSVPQTSRSITHHTITNLFKSFKEVIMSVGELGCTYACLILSDDGIPVTAEKISTILKAANVTVESYWPSLFAKFAEKKSIDDLVMNVGAGGGGGAVSFTAQAAGAAEAKAPVEEKKEELMEESDDDIIGNSLFD